MQCEKNSTHCSGFEGGERKPQVYLHKEWRSTLEDRKGKEMESPLEALGRRAVLPTP